MDWTDAGAHRRAGSVAFDPGRGLVLVNTSRVAHIVTLIPRDRYSAERAVHPTIEYGRQAGTPYAVSRDTLLSPLGIPCNPPPWGTLAAVEAATGRVRREVPLGTTRDLTPLPIAIRWGTPNMGRPITTASGLAFIGAAMDNDLRAFDSRRAGSCGKAGCRQAGKPRGGIRPARPSPVKTPPANFAAWRTAGGQGKSHEFAPPLRASGHALVGHPAL